MRYRGTLLGTLHFVQLRVFSDDAPVQLRQAACDQMIGKSVAEITTKLQEKIENHLRTITSEICMTVRNISTVSSHFLMRQSYSPNFSTFLYPKTKVTWSLASKFGAKKDRSCYCQTAV